MKNTYLILLTFIGLLFASCEPMEDIHEEIGATIGGVSGEVDYTLTEDDYEALLGEDADQNFSSEDEARELIPALLTDLYPTLGAGSTVNVQYALFDPIVAEEYTLVDQDYADFGLENNYFASASSVSDFLEFKFDGAEEGSYVEVTYQVTATDIEYELSDDDFGFIEDELGETYPEPASSAGRFDNFDRREFSDAYWTDEMIFEAINILLTERLDGVTGQTYKVVYPVFTGSSGEESVTVVFDGNEFVEFSTTPAGEDYVITDADVDLIVEGLADDSSVEDPLENLGRFGNFNRQPGSDNYWSDNSLAKAFTVVLNANFPDAEDGKVFVVEYDFYDGSSGTGNLAVIKNGDDYEIATSVSTITETTVFAYTNGTWNQPLELDREDYTEMGQRFPNFDDYDEAINKLEVFLGLRFPYAEEGDMMAVAYDFYGGSSVGTYRRYSNFVFENGEWNGIREIRMTSLQFGNNGTIWEPDNTIRYNLTSADIATIVSALGDDYPGPTSNVERFGSFDVRDGSSNYWSPEMFLEAMNIILDDVAPNATEGQKYVVTITIYDGSVGTRELFLIKEGGMWVYQE